MRHAVTIGGGLLTALIAWPTLAQQTLNLKDIDPIDPIFVPVPGQATDGEAGGLFREIEPMPLPRAQPGAAARDAPGPETIQAPGSAGSGRLLGGGYAESGGGSGSGGFIDRSFGIPADGGADRPSAGLGEEIPNDGGFSADWFGGGDQAEEDEDGTLTGRRRFKEAPATSARLFGPNMPSPLPAFQTVEATGGQIRNLDKMTGAIETRELKAGDTVALGRLKVTLDACRRPASEGLQGTMAFLRIWDPRVSEEKPVFSGWMFAESPALSALDHPRYDVWVVNCSETTAQATENTAGEG